VIMNDKKIKRICFNRSYICNSF